MRNPVNEFFRRVKTLTDLSCLRFSDYDQDSDYKIMYNYCHEAHAEDCHKLDNGLWESEPIDAGKYWRIHRFLWRLDPNYCSHGRPFFSTERVKAFRDNSEREKIILEWEGFEFCWGWEQIRMPTEIFWGMSMGPTHWYVRRDGKFVVGPQTVKKHFREAWKHVFDGL